MKKYPNFFIGIKEEFRHFMYRNYMDNPVDKRTWHLVTASGHIQNFDPKNSVVIFGESCYRLKEIDYIIDYVKAKKSSLISEEKTNGK